MDRSFFVLHLKVLYSGNVLLCKRNPNTSVRLNAEAVHSKYCSIVILVSLVGQLAGKGTTKMHVGLKFLIVIPYKLFKYYIIYKNLSVLFKL